MNIAASLPNAPAVGLIGPNAVLQLLDVLEVAFGPRETRRLLNQAGMHEPPSNHGLMNELPASALHRVIREQHPKEAETLLREAGQRTADYVMAHRIPGPAKTVLSTLPRALAGPMLLKAVARHAWTFAGSGTFEVISTKPMVVALHNNPLIAGEQSDHMLCVWHAAVFERLFSALSHREAVCRETCCQAAGGEHCRFEIS